MRQYILCALALLLPGIVSAPAPAAVPAPPPIDIALFLAVARDRESGGEPWPDGALRRETLPDGTDTLARGRFQILETTLAEIEPGLHPSWLHHPREAERIARLILARCLTWYPHASPKRLAYCWRAGLRAEPYARRQPTFYAERVAAEYRRLLAAAPILTKR